MEHSRLGKLLRSPGTAVLLLCAALGVGVFLGALIFRYRSGETIVVTRAEPTAASASPQALLDLNTADEASLECLPGIGPALAKRIVSYREENGPFSYCYELTDVPGIGSAVFEGLRELVTVVP